VLVVNRYRVDPDALPELLALASQALQTLGEQRGFVAGRVGRSMDEHGLCIVVTEWQSVGAYRRALSSQTVKLHAVPLMYQAIDEPSAFEVLLEHTGEGVTAFESDVAADSLNRPEHR
jgi:heme oxygenase (mycobilin-producing)